VIPGQGSLPFDSVVAVSPDGTHLAVAASTGNAFLQEIVVINSGRASTRYGAAAWSGPPLP
jgi:hypothetical protein